ncbi:erythrocyte membrane protein 1, PfEMP1, putative [Plasmodium sp. DRC-Itaito]|nr:erythrocyte membrane protein 1, PfEMP1, putative [Plasmodium sp. DRC-Itaito]
MCEKWHKNDKVDILDKLKEEWDKDNNKHNDIPGNNIHSGVPTNNIRSSDIQPSDIPSSNKMLNTDVSIQIDMDTNQVENTNPMYQNPNLVENNNPVDSNTPHHNPTKVHIELSVINSEMMEENFPIGDVWDI